MAKGLRYYSKVFAWTLKHYSPKHDVTIETENGLLSVSNKDWLIGKHLFVHRNFELDLIKNTIDFLRSEGFLKQEINNIALDIGANLGMIGIALVNKKFFDGVWAFEPSPSSFRLLEKNVRQNDLQKQIRCFNFALSSENKLREFEIASDNSGDNRVKLTNSEGKLNEQFRETVEIPGRRFDDFLTEHPELNRDEIDLIWMDIQGHEGHFFKGAEDFLKKRKIPCVSEFWEYGIRRAGMTQEEYCAILKTVFTHFYRYTENSFQLNPISGMENLFKGEDNPRHIESIVFVNNG